MVESSTPIRRDDESGIAIDDNTAVAKSMAVATSNNHSGQPHHPIMLMQTPRATEMSRVNIRNISASIIVAIVKASKMCITIRNTLLKKDPPRYGRCSGP